MSVELVFEKDIMAFSYYKTVSKLNGKVYFIKRIVNYFLIINIQDQTLEKMEIVYPCQIFNFYEYLIGYKTNRFNIGRYTAIEANDQEKEEIKKIEYNDFTKNFYNEFPELPELQGISETNQREAK